MKVNKRVYRYYGPHSFIPLDVKIKIKINLKEKQKQNGTVQTYHIPPPIEFIPSNLSH